MLNELKLRDKFDISNFIYEIGKFYFLVDNNRFFFKWVNLFFYKDLL